MAGGGAGHMLQMVQQLRANRALLGKRKSFKDLREDYLKYAKRIHIDYKKASPEQLKLVRAQIKMHKEKELFKLLVAGAITGTIILGLFLYFASIF